MELSDWCTVTHRSDHQSHIVALPLQHSCPNANVRIYPYLIHHNKLAKFLKQYWCVDINLHWKKAHKHEMFNLPKSPRRQNAAIKRKQSDTWSRIPAAQRKRARTDKWDCTRLSSFYTAKDQGKEAAYTVGENLCQVFIWKRIDIQNI